MQRHDAIIWSGLQRVLMKEVEHMPTYQFILCCIDIRLFNKLKQSPVTLRYVREYVPWSSNCVLSRSYGVLVGDCLRSRAASMQVSSLRFLGAPTAYKKTVERQGKRSKIASNVVTPQSWHRDEIDMKAPCSRYRTP